MKTKILISYREKHHLIRSEVLTPIQTGCALTDEHFPHMLRDDVGENISARNDSYCELSALYWAWKNYAALGEPDYVGFMHYRRHFMFDGWRGNPEWVWLTNGHVYFVPCVTPEYLEHLSDSLIEEQLRDCDCIVLKPYDVAHLHSLSVREQYAKLPGQRAEWFDILIEELSRLHPDYAEAIRRVQCGSVQYLCNMFIMQKELFFEYCEFCFSTLEAVDRRVNSKGLNDQEIRFLGYLGEFCLTVFLFHLRSRGARIKELEGSYILADEPVRHPGLLYAFYRIMCKVTFGRARRRFKEKRRSMRALRRFFRTP